MDHVLKQARLKLLTPLKRQDYRYYLNNRTATSEDIDQAARRRAAANKYWALTYFELQDN
jgi:predicted S18 family serine protease